MTDTGLIVLFGADGSITFRGTSKEIKTLSECIINDDDAKLELAQTQADPVYSGTATAVSIRPDDKPGLAILREGTEVIIVGDPVSRSILAHNLRQYAASPTEASDHLHIEHYPGNVYIRSGSAPVIVRMA